jgi:hypothetical protein
VYLDVLYDNVKSWTPAHMAILMERLHEMNKGVNGRSNKVRAQRVFQATSKPSKHAQIAFEPADHGLAIYNYDGHVTGKVHGPITGMTKVVSLVVVGFSPTLPHAPVYRLEIASTSAAISFGQFLPFFDTMSFLIAQLHIQRRRCRRPLVRNCKLH